MGAGALGALRDWIDGDPVLLARSLVLACHGFALSAQTMAGPRVYAKMAADGFLPRWDRAYSALVEDLTQRGLILRGDVPSPVNPPETRIVSPPNARIVRTSVLAPGLGRMRSARQRPMTASSSPLSSATRAGSPSSGSPVTQRDCSSYFTSAIFCGVLAFFVPVPCGFQLPFPVSSFWMISSTYVFHSPQAGHRPIHLGLCAPQF